jgi:hypothetical protein
LGGDIFGGDIESARWGLAAFEGVGSEEGKMAAKGIGADGIEDRLDGGVSGGKRKG